VESTHKPVHNALAAMLPHASAARWRPKRFLARDTQKKAQARPGLFVVLFVLVLSCGHDISIATSQPRGASRSMDTVAPPHAAWRKNILK